MTPVISFAHARAHTGAQANTDNSSFAEASMQPVHAAEGAASARHPTDFSHAPFLVIWEVTRACALACAVP